MEQFRFAMVYILFTIIGVTIYVSFFSSIVKLLNEINVKNRYLEPQKVWLMLIPFYNCYWFFVLVDKVSKSIYAEYVYRNIPIAEKPTYTLGIIASIGFLIWGIDMSFGRFLISVPFLPSVCSLIMFTGLVCNIVYWIQIVEHKNKIRHLQI